MRTEAERSDATDRVGLFAALFFLSPLSCANANTLVQEEEEEKEED